MCKNPLFSHFRTNQKNDVVIRIGIPMSVGGAERTQHPPPAARAIICGERNRWWRHHRLSRSGRAITTQCHRRRRPRSHRVFEQRRPTTRERCAAHRDPFVGVWVRWGTRDEQGDVRGVRRRRHRSSPSMSASSPSEHHRRTAPFVWACRDTPSLRSSLRRVDSQDGAGEDENEMVIMIYLWTMGQQRQG